MRVLLTDGSGLTSRQVATQLAAGGHRVDVLAPDGLCLTRFTRHVHRVRRVPAYGLDPFAWLDAAVEVYETGRFDVLFPTQEQVPLLAREATRLDAAGVATVVPTFDSVAAVQDKLAAAATLADAAVPQPEQAIMTTLDQADGWARFPAFVKSGIGTAASGVQRVTDVDDLRRVLAGLGRAGGLAAGVLVQAAVDGPLAMVQTVFCRGELLAAHANLRVSEGARGGAAHKRSVTLPDAVDQMRRLGSHLAWHGALSADVILTAGGCVVIDVNPRLVEPGNAWRAGVDLVTPMLTIARGDVPAAQPPGAHDVATHQLLVALLGAAQHGGRRRDVAGELVAAVAGRRHYRDSVEELTPVRGDPLAAVPVALAAVATLVRPATWRWFASGSVAGYALTPQAWTRIRG